MTNRVFLVTLTINIPVSADSEEEVRDFLLNEDCDVLEQSMAQVKANMLDEGLDTKELFVDEITEDTLDDEYMHSDFEDCVPWGDDSDETVGERVRAESEEPDDDEEQGWGEPSHEDD